MKYSIIVPIYKIEKYLSQCIESVLVQDFKDYELILVDDGSPDSCPQICDSYAERDNRIKVVHKENGGLVSARKAGLAISSGDYAFCLDGDDFLHPECLQRVNNVLEQYKPDVICFGYIIFSEQHERMNPINLSHGFFSRNEMEKDILPNMIHTKSGNRLPPVVWSKVFKMDLYRKYQNLVCSQISMGEDGACSYPLISNANSIFIMKDCLYYYRQIETSMTKVKKPLIWENYDKVFALYEHEIDLEKCDLRVQLFRARTHNLFNLCMSQFYSGDTYRNVVSAIKEQFVNHPEYDAAIKGSDFDSFMMKLVRTALLYKFYPLFYMYSRIK